MQRSLILISSLLSLTSLRAELLPAKVDKTLLIPKDTEVQILGKSESPTALAMSEMGEIFITETARFGEDRGIDDNRVRKFWIIDDLASRTTADRLAMYKKWAKRKPMSIYTAHSERIRRIIPGPQGKAVENSIWASDFNDALDGTMAGIGVYDGKVYASCIPHLWQLEDTDGDGKADVRKSLQDGFGVRVSISGHDMNGFALGPDGRLYWTIGDRGFNIKTKEGKQLTYLGEGAVLRMEPDGSDLEVIHNGLRNPKELAFNEFGDAITVDNNSDQGDQCRVIYVVEGADSGWRMGHQILLIFHDVLGIDKRPTVAWMAEKMWQTQTSDQPAFILPPIAHIASGPSGLDYHPGIGVGESGQFLVCDYRGGAAQSSILSFKLHHQGAGMSFTNTGTFHAGAAVTDVMYGYDGNVYVSDFGEGWTASDKGRIYRIIPKGGSGKSDTLALMQSKFWTRDATALFPLLKHPDLRVRTRAHIALADQKNLGITTLLKASHSDNDPVMRRHAVWGLWVAARRAQSLEATARLADLLADSDPEIRAQAARAYGDAFEAKSALLIPLLKDPSLRVRFFSSLSLARIGDRDSVSPILAMLAENNGRDVHLRHAGLQALRKCATPADMLALADAPHEHEKNLCAVLTLRSWKHQGLTKFLFSKDDDASMEAIRAIHDQQLIDLRPALSQMLERKIKAVENGGNIAPMTTMILRRLIHAAYREGGEHNAGLLVRLAAQQKFPVKVAREALVLLAKWEQPCQIDQSIGHHDPIPNREVKSLRILLEKSLATILSQNNPQLYEALALVLHYELNVLGIDADRYKEIASSKSQNPETSALAVRCLLRVPCKDLHSVLISFTQSHKAPIVIAALDSLQQISPADTRTHLLKIIADPTTPIPARQHAWKLLEKHNHPEVIKALTDAIRRLATPKGDWPCAIEITALAEFFDDATLKKTLLDYHAREQSFPLGKWQQTLAGGDATHGRSLFQSHTTAQCLRCHSIKDNQDIDGGIGPSLASIAHRSNIEMIVSSIIHPNADIVAGYGTITLTFPNGTSISGVLEKETPDSIFISNGDEIWKVAKKQKFTKSDVISAMPPMEHILTPREVRDIAAYLSTLKSEHDLKYKDLSQAKEFIPTSPPTQ